MTTTLFLSYNCAYNTIHTDLNSKFCYCSGGGNCQKTFEIFVIYIIKDATITRKIKILPTGSSIVSKPDIVTKYVKFQIDLL